ncbi:MAG: hypothetical protein H6767_04620 [Candidatus Peribacteria bacterium]|nr:MAG: hypothetical protein H6767_04620 [Candidatus Peribacteria bacterium]
MSKHFATAYLLQQVNIFGDIVYFLYTENTGIAFSLPLSGVLLQLITVILT